MRHRLMAMLALVLACSGVVAMGQSTASADGTRSGSAALPRVSHADAVRALHRVQRAFQPQPNSSARRTAPAPRTDLTLALRDLYLARPSLTGADRAAADAFLARPTTHTSSNDIDIWDYSADEMAPGNIHRTCSTHFCVTYTTSHNSNYVNKVTGERLDNSATAATAARDLIVLEQVYAKEVTGMGYRAPLGDWRTADGSYNNFDGRIDVYLTNLSAIGYYGYCSVDDQSLGGSRHRPAYCVLDNDFLGFPRPALQSLEVTAAHEFFHAIQFGYDVGEDRWMLEGSAVWMEDQVYNSINDYLQYVPASPIRNPRIPVDYNGQLNVYGAFTFFKFMSSYFKTPDIVRQLWAAVDASNPKDLYSLQAIATVIKKRHQNVRDVIARFGAWNTLPKGSYPERRSYLPWAAWLAGKLSKAHPTTHRHKIKLDHLATAPVMMVPTKKLSKTTQLQIKVDAPKVKLGGAAMVQIRMRSGRVKLTKFHLNRQGNGTRTVTFNPRKVASVVLTLTNGSIAMKGCHTNHPYACGGIGAHQKAFRFSAKLLNYR